MKLKAKSTEWPEDLKIHILKEDVDVGEDCSPHRCAAAIATKRAIGGHGYVSVDSSGISITRRSDFREKAFTPRPLQKWYIAFDKWKHGHGPRPKPASFALRFFKTSPIVKRDREELNAARRLRKAQGKKEKKYNVRSRILGFAD